MISRRDFLKLAGMSAASGLLAACAPPAFNALANTPTPFPTDLPKPTGMPTSRPDVVSTSTVPPTPDIRKMATEMAQSKMACSTKSVETIVTNGVKIASPISNRPQHALDMQAYNNILHNNILPGYSGEHIELGNGDVAVSVNTGRVIIGRGVALNPVASAYFEESGQNVAMITLPIRDKAGNRSGMHVILTPGNAESRPQALTQPDEILGRLPGRVADDDLASLTLAHAPLDGNLGRYNTETSKKYFANSANNGLGTTISRMVIEGESANGSEDRALVAAAWFYPDGK